MIKKVLITGATGFIGYNICQELTNRGDLLTVLSRNPEKARKELPFVNDFVKWDYKRPDEWKEHINSKNAVIHLAGANLFGKRWTKNYKKVIIESRETSTINLIKTIGEVENKPEVFVCSSAVGFYGNSGDKILTENSPAGNDFTSNVCKKWEKAASLVEQFKVRRISIRTGIVLSRNEGSLQKMIPPFKFFIGGPLGTGNQWFPWIHIKDLVKIFLFVLDNDKITGSLNAASPNPVRMKEFTQELGRILNRPSFFKVPSIILKIALGEFAETILASLRVRPEKLIQYNFNFRFRNLRGALEDLLKGSSTG